MGFFEKRGENVGIFRLLIAYGKYFCYSKFEGKSSLRDVKDRLRPQVFGVHRPGTEAPSLTSLPRNEQKVNTAESPAKTWRG